LTDLESEPPLFDCHAPLLSLPGIFGTNDESIPAAVPYLSAGAKLAALWRERLAGLGGFKIGIAWQGSSNYASDRDRSFRVIEFAPLAAIPGITLISLQKGEGAEQLRASNLPFSVVNFGDELDASAGAFMDSAAIMTNVDLVVTSDTAIAHLGGALGVPTWVALPFSPDWRWRLHRSESPWYPTMRLFRQPRQSEWSTVFREMAAAVVRLENYRA